jgi:hypothetical protein
MGGLMAEQFGLENFSTFSDKELHSAAMSASQNHKLAEATLVSVLEVVEQKQIYLEFGTATLFKYCVEILDLSKAISYELVAVINKGREVPEIKSAVKNGEISLSKAKKICSVITPADHKQWLALARVETSRNIEKCVGLARPEKTVESAFYKTEDRLQYQLGVSEVWMTELEEVKNLLSQKLERAVASEEALQILMKEFIQKNDPVKKAERAVKRFSKRVKRETQLNQQTNSSRELKRADSPGERPPSRKRTKIKCLTIHSLNLRDQHRCTYVGFHGRCDEKRWLDVHHVTHVEHGGGNELENLAILCRRHHAKHHVRHHT